MIVITAYLTIKFFRAIFWCFAAMIWLCFAFGGWTLVLGVAAISLVFDRQAARRIIRQGAQTLALPEYLKVK